MHRLGARALRHLQDGGDVHVALLHGGGAHEVALVHGGGVQPVGVGLGVDAHGGDTEAAAGAGDARGDLAPVGDEDPGEHAGEGL